jgi:hypothetical protein
MYLSVHEEYDAVRVVCGTQKRLQICEKYVKTYSENMQKVFKRR